MQTAEEAVNRLVEPNARADIGRSSTRRARLARFVESNAVQKVIITLIVLNAITLGLETSETVMREIGQLVALDRIFLMIFVVEITLRIAAHGRKFLTRGMCSIFS